MSDLLTMQLTYRQARALHSALSMFSQAVSDMNPEWANHLEADGEPPALTTGILALEACLIGASA